MMLLAIDTATRWTGLALHDGQTLLAEVGWHAFKRQTIELAPRIDVLLRDYGLPPGDLQGIAVASGPGSYTGLRIGLSVAKGIALVHGTPLYAVPTLSITAAGTPLFPEKTLLVVIEAGRRRVIAGRFMLEGERWQPAGRPAIQTWAELLAGLDRPAVITGEIAAEARAAIGASGAPCRLLSPAAAARRAGWLAELGLAAAAAGQSVDPQTFTPDYLRLPEGA